MAFFNSAVGVLQTLVIALDALVKDTAAKVAVDKPKAKTKSKKGPEL